MQGEPNHLMPLQRQHQYQCRCRCRYRCCWLVAKTRARQFKEQFRAGIAPANFCLAKRSGTDALVHMVRCMMEADPHCTLVSIDGVGAYDHVGRARMLDGL